MSDYPRKVGPVFECPVCRAVYRYAEYAHGCCPPRMYECGYECASATCEFEGIHVLDEDARACLRDSHSMSNCVCGHLMRHHAIARHPGCYSPGCKCMAAELVEDSDD